jgi:RNA polymerase sigma factor (sigma-70 family)
MTPLQDLNDAELVERCRQGQQAAWSTLVRRFQRLIYTVPRRAGLNDEQAADVFQTVFGRLHEHLPRLDDGSRVQAWLVTTAKRESLRVLEQSRRVVSLAPQAGADDAGAEEDPMDRLPDEGPLPEELLSMLQQHDRLRQAVDRLEPRARQFVELLFLQDEPLPYSEVAARLGIAEGSIGPTRARVLEKLRGILANL